MKAALIKIIIIITVISAVFALSVNAIDVNTYINAGQDIIGKLLLFKYDLNSTAGKLEVFSQLRAFINQNKDEYNRVIYKCTLSFPGYTDYQGYTIRITETVINPYVIRVQLGFLTHYDHEDGSISSLGLNFIDFTYDYDEREFTNSSIDGNLNRFIIQGYEISSSTTIVDFINLFYVYDVRYTVENDNQIVNDIIDDNFLSALANKLNNLGYINTNVADLLFRISLYILMNDYVKDIINLASIIGITSIVFSLMARLGTNGDTKKGKKE